MRVRDLIEMLDASVTVLTARYRLDDDIRWVHVTDLPDPAPYLHGGELILTSALWYRGPADAEQFIGGLVSRGVRAVGIALIGNATIPRALISTCAERDVLLISLPDIPFMDVTEIAIARLMEERHAGSARAVSLGRRVAERGGDAVTALLDVLRREVGAPCWILGRDALPATGPDGPPGHGLLRAVWAEGFGQHARWRQVTEIRAPHGRALTLLAVRAEHEPHATPPPAVLVYEAPLALVQPHAATVVALAERCLPMATEAGRDRRRLRRKAAEDALAQGADGVARGGEVTVLVAGPVEDGELAADALEAAVRLSGVGVGVGELADPPVAATAREGRVLAVLEAAARDPARLAEAVWRELRTVLGASAAVGLATGAGGPHGCLVEAAEAYRVALLPGRERWATAREAASHVLLLADASAGVRRVLYAGTLEPVLRHDAAHGTDLARTLAVFLDHACSWQRTAEVLHLHVNSLRYRVRRIEELTGRNLGDMADRVDMYLGLRAGGPTS
ncbi:PucR family transcriptional regulator [Pseudonocardia acaciae]|uniref:PucR family transcriptional regulator n=1 Tax=Pseudonocardia acaciae TaxID=551276 RepID=UPI000491ABB4|nr:PucR family transcriptional regulator [Pseudonocardia acaciae]